MHIWLLHSPLQRISLSTNSLCHLQATPSLESIKAESLQTTCTDLLFFSRSPFTGLQRPFQFLGCLKKPRANALVCVKDYANLENSTARKALDLDGFRDVDPSSEKGQRLLRRRERYENRFSFFDIQLTGTPLHFWLFSSCIPPTNGIDSIWLALFVLDRGVCLARGRSFTIPLTPIIEHCDGWHQSPIADIWDGSLISSAVLRRELVSN